MSNEVNNEMVMEAPEVAVQPVETKKKHSKLGIASFILALLAGVGIIGGFVMTTMATLSIADPSVMADPDALMNSDIMGTMMISGSLMTLGGVVAFVGLILGVIGLFMKNVKKGFAIAGTIMNAIPVVGTIVMMIVGFAAASAMM